VQDALDRAAAIVGKTIEQRDLVAR
jgi:hypothetical protein